jgi:hypothetical protein
MAAGLAFIFPFFRILQAAGGGAVINVYYIVVYWLKVFRRCFAEYEKGSGEERILMRPPLAGFSKSRCGSGRVDCK